MFQITYLKNKDLYLAVQLYKKPLTSNKAIYCTKGSTN